MFTINRYRLYMEILNVYVMLAEPGLDDVFTQQGAGAAVVRAVVQHCTIAGACGADLPQFPWFSFLFCLFALRALSLSS